MLSSGFYFGTAFGVLRNHVISQSTDSPLKCIIPVVTGALVSGFFAGSGSAFNPQDVWLSTALMWFFGHWGGSTATTIYAAVQVGNNERGGIGAGIGAGLTFVVLALGDALQIFPFLAAAYAGANVVSRQ